MNLLGDCSLIRATGELVLRVRGGMVNCQKQLKIGGTFIYDVKKAGTVSTFVLLFRLEIFNLTS